MEWCLQGVKNLGESLLEFAYNGDNFDSGTRARLVWQLQNESSVQVLF